MTRRSDTATTTGGFITETILKNIRVLAIDQAIQEDEEGRRVKVGETATLELTPQQAEIITVAQQMADRLTLALRALVDTQEKVSRRGRLSGLRQRQARHGPPDQIRRSFRSGGKEMNSRAIFAGHEAGRRARRLHDWLRRSACFWPAPACRSTGAYAGGQAQVGSMAATQRVKLGLNKSVVIDLPADAYDILVANPAVADAVTRTARRIYLFGKIGRRNQHLRLRAEWRADRQPRSRGRARCRRPRGIHQALHSDSDIKVELINDNVVLTGTVDTPLDAKRAADRSPISSFSGGEATTGQYSQTAAASSDGGGVDIDNPDSERRVSQIVNLHPDHRRRPGDAEGHGRRSQPQRHEAAQRQHDRRRQLQRHQLGRDQRNLPGLGKPLARARSSRIGTSMIDAYLNAMEQAGVMKTLGRADADGGFRRAGDVQGRRRVQSRDQPAAQSRRQPDGTITYDIEKLEYGIGLEFKPVVLSAGTHQPEDPHFGFRADRRSLGDACRRRRSAALTSGSLA